MDRKFNINEIESREERAAFIQRQLQKAPTRREKQKGGNNLQQHERKVILETFELILKRLTSIEKTLMEMKNK